MNRKSAKSFPYLFLIPAAAILCIGIAYFFLGRDIIYFGDDIGYFRKFHEWRGTWKGIPIAMHQHWEGYNGRMCDMLAPIPLNLLGANTRGILNGLMTMLFFAAPLLLTRFRENAALKQTIFIAVLAFTLRWDSIWMENITQQDYVWPAAFALALCALMLRGRPRSEVWWLWLSLPLCVAAGWMHEALGAPLACGIFIYSFTSGFWKRAGNARRAMAIAFIAGGIFSVCAPTNFARFFKVQTLPAVETPLRLLIFSDYWMLVMLLAIVAAAIFRPKALAELFRSSWTIWCIAALVSTVFLLAAGYPGRPGWYSQIFALIALFSLAEKTLPAGGAHPGRGLALSLFLLALIIFHFTALAVTQHRLSTESREILLACRDSETGTIFRDYTHEPDLPFYLLRKEHCFPDEDDLYYRMKMSDFYCRGRKITVLPEAARAIHFDRLDAPRRFGDDYISPAPLKCDPAPFDSFSIPTRIVMLRGRRYAESQFQTKQGGKTFYYYTPEDQDAGCH